MKASFRKPGTSVPARSVIQPSAYSLISGFCLTFSMTDPSILPGFEPAGPAGKRVRSLERLPHFIVHHSILRFFAACSPIAVAPRAQQKIERQARHHGEEKICEIDTRIYVVAA